MSTSSLDAVKSREESLLCRGYGRYPIAVASGKGSRLTDIDGKEYVDLLAGIAVTSLGHCNEELAQVIEKQARKLIHVSNLFYQEEQLDLAEELLSLAHFGKAFFCNSGAEANEAQIKLARRYMQRVRNRDAYEIITLDKAFHGRTYATMAATGQERFQDGFAPMPEGFKTVPWGDLNALEAAITPKTAAVLVEIVQGEGGIRPMYAEYAKGIEALCRKKDILFLVDEVQGGLFRTGKPWAFQHFDLRPDAISCAKALANGLPMGAIMATDEVAKGFVTGSHATTFGGGALTSAVAAAVIRIMKRDRLDERAASVGGAFMERMRRLAESLPGTIREVRGLGLMIGVELAFPAKEVWEELIRRGFICNLSHETVLRLLPALNIPEEDLTAFADTLEDILADIRK
ncbi:aspartate aminotransferase family protein [uncultured Bilophila sp.]|uniref:aspartate aminotransferase family protein n=1 Tax=uncultured Bilophila sp. TaxID=529385 RepID=UPI0025EE5560|nr:aspartate aminotransferase family protein [uncultured Bilophila sp.]